MLKTLRTLSREGISMSEWCQNPKCPEKKTSGQIRGTKGNKWYQSNKSQGYGGGNFCTLGCYDSWAEQYMAQAIDSLGVRITNPVKIYLEDAWYVKSEYNWNSGNCNYLYHLINKNKGIKQQITREQAQTEENIKRGYNHAVIDDTQARELAIQLGLAN